MHALTLLLALQGPEHLLRRAPAPLPRQPRPPAQVTPGAWVLEWGGPAEPCCLGADGSYTWGTSYAGVWRWDPRTRTLFVVEWLRWEPWREHIWSVVLDRELAGVTEAGMRVKLTRKGGRP